MRNPLAVRVKPEVDCSQLDMMHYASFVFALTRCGCVTGVKGYHR